MSLFDIISVVFPDPNIFLCFPASAPDAVAVSPKGINTFFAKGVTTFFISGNPVFSNGPSNYWEILLIVSFLITESLKI